MALSSQATFTSSPIPSPPETPDKWSITQENILPSTVSNHLIYQDDQQPSINEVYIHTLFPSFALFYAKLLSYFVGVVVHNHVSILLQDEFNIKNHQKKLRSLKHMLNKEGEDAFEGLAMVDAIQRLGIEYHFQEEIDMILQRHYMMHGTHNYNDLHEAALSFRLLRQAGYHVLAGWRFFCY